jgi:hypothetical protein
MAGLMQTPDLSRRLLNLAYWVAASLIRLKKTPILRVISAGVAIIFVIGTFLTSNRVNNLSLFSGVLVLATNSLQLLLMLWKQRPVILEGEERKLHDLVYPNLSASDFQSLMQFAVWKDGGPGDVLALQGSEVNEVTVLVRGGAEVERDGRLLASLGAGAIVGEIGSLSAKPFSSTIRLVKPSRYVVWKKDSLENFFSCHPSIASSFEQAFILRLDTVPKFRSASENGQA